MPTLNDIQRLTKQREDYIEKQIDFLWERVGHADVDLYNLLIDELIFEFDADDIGLEFSEKNVGKLSLVGGIWDKFNTTVQIPLLLWLAQSVLRQVKSSEKYFSLFGEAPPLNITLLKQTLGVNADVTALVEGSYLAGLSKNEELVQTLKQYIVNSLANQSKYTDFIDGFRGLIMGTDEVEGGLTRYYKTYANDIYNQFQRLTDLQLAKKMGMSKFLYAGTIIPTSRNFCIARAGLVFTVDQTKDWFCDPDLPSNYKGGCTDNYQPLIELGQYNCRHSVAWINDKMADVLNK
jgi:hypothetical protein